MYISVDVNKKKKKKQAQYHPSAYIRKANMYVVSVGTVSASAHLQFCICVIYIQSSTVYYILG